MPRRALITGITGQDGAYLARLLLEEGYAVYGACRRNSTPNLQRLNALAIADKVTVVPFDLLEPSNISLTLASVHPDELYNFAAQSFVPLSFDLPEYTGHVNAIGVVRLLEAVRTVLPSCRLYQASTSEMFGSVDSCPQNEQTRLRPKSPYAAAKAYAHFMVRMYREAYGMHASSGILFNHESPLRGPEFLTRKVTLALARMRHGSDEVIRLGNLNARRDWGCAQDYMRAVHLMVKQDQADDYVIATGESHSVREWVDRAASRAGFRLVWERERDDVRAVDQVTGRIIVRVDPALVRVADVAVLQGDPSKANVKLGWRPKVRFEQLVDQMVEADLDSVAGQTLADETSASFPARA